MASRTRLTLKIGPGGSRTHAHMTWKPFSALPLSYRPPARTRLTAQVNPSCQFERSHWLHQGAAPVERTLPYNIIAINKRVPM
jgi:hypothetical protein